jgi:hypothetical protein
VVTVFVFKVGCVVSILSKVNVKMLRLLNVVVISCAEQSNQRMIMNEAVKLWNVEVLLHTKVSKNNLF